MSANRPVSARNTVRLGICPDCGTRYEGGGYDHPVTCPLF